MLSDRIRAEGRMTTARTSNDGNITAVFLAAWQTKKIEIFSGRNRYGQLEPVVASSRRSKQNKCEVATGTQGKGERNEKANNLSCWKKPVVLPSSSDTAEESEAGRFREEKKKYRQIARDSLLPF